MTVWAWGGYYSTRQEPKPTVKVRRLADLIRSAYAVGEDFGFCHIVLADINIEKEHIQWCLDQNEIEKTPEGVAAMEAMLAAPKRERAIALCLANGESFIAYSDAEWAAFDQEA